MKVISIIPARYNSIRFPGKLMEILGKKTVILNTYENVLATNLFNDVIVATDSQIIFNEINQNGGKVVMTKNSHKCGSDRIAEAVSGIDADIVINVQGDEPFIDLISLKKLIDIFKDDKEKSIQLASLMTEFKYPEESTNPTNVKVVVDLNNFALYFSRALIPYSRESNLKPIYYKHIGVYAFRKNALLEFSKLETTPLEASEKIECIRYLEHGKKLKMIYTDKINLGIDTPEDLARAQAYMKEMNL